MVIALKELTYFVRLFENVITFEKPRIQYFFLYCNLCVVKMVLLMNPYENDITSITQDNLLNFYSYFISDFQQ